MGGMCFEIQGRAWHLIFRADADIADILQFNNKPCQNEISEEKQKTTL